MEIKELDLTGKQLNEIPELPWERFNNLRSVDLSGNNLDIVPIDFANIPQLERVVSVEFSNSY